MKKKKHVGTSLASLEPKKPILPLRVAIGEMITVKSVTMAWANRDECEQHTKTMTGTVIYIHPKHRFFTVEYRLKRGTCCECFPMVR